MKRNYLSIVFFFGLGIAALTLIIFGWQTDADTEGYLQLIRFLNGEPTEITAYRTIKPLGPLLAIPLNLFFSAEKSLIFENIFFFIGSGFLMYAITEKISKNKKQALMSAMLFLTAYPVLRWGIAALTDMSGWFFYLLTILLTFKFLETKNEKFIWWNGAIAAIAILFKETGGLGMLFFTAMILMHAEFPWKRKIAIIGKTAFAGLIPLFLIELFIFWKMQYSFIDWFQFIYGIAPKESLGQTLFHLAQNTFAMLFLGWIFVVRGIFLEIKEKISPEKKERLKIYGALLIPSLAFFLWPFWVTRLMFIAGPLLCIIASRGLLAEKKKTQSALYVTFIVAIAINFLLPKYVNLSSLQDVLEFLIR